MNLIIQETEGLTEPEVTVRCEDPSGGEAAELLAALRAFAAARSGPLKKLTGWRDGQAYPLDPGDVLYIETVDKRTFLYTAGGVYETDLRLYELEERLQERDFFRAGKSMLANFNAIRSLRPDLGGRLRMTMKNSEVVYVSRQYAPWLKKKLGI